MIVMVCGGISVSGVMDRVSMPIGVSRRSQMIELGQLFVTNVASFQVFLRVSLDSIGTGLGECTLAATKHES